MLFCRMALYDSEFLLRRQSLLLTAPRRLTWVEETLPAPQADEILVQTVVGAISIGTELPQYLGRARQAAPLAFPRMTGYENVATVVACGRDVQHLTTGQRVVGFYGHRTHALMSAAKAILVPDDIPDELALLAILSCDVAKGVRKVRPYPEARVLITGAGAIGLLTLFVLRAYGVQHIDVIEPLRKRRELALHFGARHVFTPDDAQGEYAVAFECSSRDAAFAHLQRLVQYNGRICILADGNREPLTLAPDFHAKELTLVASSDGWDYHQHAAWFFEVIRREKPPLAQLFEHEIKADKLPAVFEQLADGEIMPVKILVRYQ